MNLTVHKAESIQQSIKECLKSIEIRPWIEINRDDDIAEKLTKANEKLFANDARKQKLLLALYNIQTLINTAVVTGNIDINISKHNFIVDRIKQLKDIAQFPSLTPLAELDAKIDMAKRGEYSGVILNTGLATEEQLDIIKKEIDNLTKQKQDILQSIRKRLGKSVKFKGKFIPPQASNNTCCAPTDTTPKFSTEGGSLKPIGTA